MGNCELFRDFRFLLSRGELKYEADLYPVGQGDHFKSTFYDVYNSDEIQSMFDKQIKRVKEGLDRTIKNLEQTYKIRKVNSVVKDLSYY